MSIRIRISIMRCLIFEYLNIQIYLCYTDTSSINHYWFIDMNFFNFDDHLMKNVIQFDGIIISRIILWICFFQFDIILIYYLSFHQTNKENKCKFFTSPIRSSWNKLIYLIRVNRFIWIWFFHTKNMNFDTRLKPGQNC